MDNPTRPEPPGPTGAADLVELVRRAGDLWRWAGQPSEEQLRSAAEAPGATGGPPPGEVAEGIIELVLTGNGLTWGTLEPFVLACLRCGNRPPDRTDIDLGNWRTTWAAVESAETWSTGYDPYPATEPAPVSDPTQASDVTQASEPTQASDVTPGPTTEPVAISAPSYFTTEPIPVVSAPPPVQPVQPVQPVRYSAPLTAPEPWVVSHATPPRSSRRLPVILGSVVGVITLVAVGVTVAVAGGDPHQSGSGSASGSTSAGSTTTLPDGMALPAQAPLPSTSASASASPSPSHTTTTATTASGSQTAPGDVLSPGRTTSAAPPVGAASNPPATTRPTTSSPTPSPKPSPTAAPPTVCTSDGHCAGKAYFVADGEHLWVCDQLADGHGVVAQYTRTDVPGQNNEAVNTGGAGTCIDHNMNMPEGAKITFRVCLKEGSSSDRFSCGSWKTAVS